MPAGFPLPVLHCPLQVPGIHIGGQHLAAVRRGKQGVPAQGVQLRLVKGGGGHARQNVLCGFLAGLRGLIRGQKQPAVLDPQQQHQQPPHRDQQAGQRRAHQILQQHAAQRGQSSLFHRYPTPHTVLSSFSGSGTPAARNFARIFLMCCVTAVSSAVPSMPKTAS